MSSEQSFPWSCGHVATVMCMECHQELIRRANDLAAENERLSARAKTLENTAKINGTVAKDRGAEIERLLDTIKMQTRARIILDDEIERLTAVWRWADPHLENMRGMYPEFDTALEHHRKALEGK